MEKKDYMSPEMELILLSMKATLLAGSVIEEDDGPDVTPDASLFYDNGSNEDW